MVDNRVCHAKVTMLSMNIHAHAAKRPARKGIGAVVGGVDSQA
jgi:hypothetical protein